MHVLTLLPKRTLTLVALVVIMSLLAACGLSTEPQVVGQTQRPTATALPASAPPSRIDLARGQAIFASDQGCAPCHGAEGRGDGPVAASFPCQILDLNDAQTLQVSVAAWYGVVSFGKTEQPGCVMPPWNRRLNDAERWDVASYIYSLKYTPGLLDQGAAVFAATCAECHGAQGLGDGPQAASLAARPANFSDPALLADRSDADVRAVLVSGIPALGEGAHRFADRLSEAEQWAAAAYVRTLGWGNAPEGAPAGPAAPTAAANAGDAANVAPAPTADPGGDAAAPVLPSELTVQGTMQMGTPGLDTPAGQPVTLRVLQLTGSGAQDVQSFEAQAGPDGAYRFEGVPRGDDLTYILTTEYDGVLQFSEPVRAGTEAALDLPLTLYAVTNDPAVIQVDLLRLFVEFQDANTAVVQHAARFVNVGDRIFLSGGQDADGKDTSIRIDMPRGARNLSINPDLGGNFTVGQNEAGDPLVFGVFPVFPGDAPVFQASYTLPVAGEVQVALANSYPVTSFVLNLPRAEGVTFQDGRFAPGAPVELNTGTYDTYNLDTPLPAGEGLSFRVTLAPLSGARPDLIIGILIGMGAVFGGAALLSVLGRRRTAADTGALERDALVQAIAALDARYEAKQIGAKAYRAERARLKAELARHMGKGARR
ncbi:MAG: c-type cytochrome [Anaerolineae bacterium]|nr:c-type cytochrome [Anaerolineae bacterium]